MSKYLKRYLVLPNGVSYDDLLSAAIVSTRQRNNVDNPTKVIDQETSQEFSLPELQKIVRSGSVKKPKERPLDNHSLFDSVHFKILPDLLE